MPDFDFSKIGDFPWPKKGELLFTSADDWWHNACLNYLPDDWETYVIGYKRAADVLVEEIKKTHQDQDVLVFPIVFLYRQYLELRLKRIIESGNKLLDENPNYPHKHELDILWNVCRSILSKLEPKVPKKDLEAIDESINQFCAIDPTSEAFRYPITNKGGKSIPSEIRHINLRQLSDIMGKVANFLNSAAEMISVYLEIKSDAEEEFRDDFGGDF